MALIVLSPRGSLRAALTERRDGVYVLIRRSVDYVASGNLLARGVVDAPFHVVRDGVADLLAELEEN